MNTVQFQKFWNGSFYHDSGFLEVIRIMNWWLDILRNGIQNLNKNTRHKLYWKGGGRNNTFPYLFCIQFSGCISFTHHEIGHCCPSELLSSCLLSCIFLMFLLVLLCVWFYSLINTWVGKLDGKFILF